MYQWYENIYWQSSVCSLTRVAFYPMPTTFPTLGNPFLKKFHWIPFEFTLELNLNRF